jgi:hypothetical protein
MPEHALAFATQNGRSRVLTRTPAARGRARGGIKEFPMQATWKPHEKHGQLTAKADLPDSVFAFPHQRKEPMTDAKHVRNAVARFDQVEDVSDKDRELAFANIKKAAEHYDVELSETSWRDLGVHPQTHRKEAAAKAVETKRERGEIK